MKNNQTCHFLFLILLLLSVAVSFLANASGNNLTDRLSLLEFKKQITNDPNGILTSRNDSFHFCNWAGITCNTHQRVTSLSLSSRNLAGTLSPHITNFTFLQTINLINNSFRGHIPPQMANLRHLQTLNQTRNSFTGKLPPNLTSCLQLRTILIERNSLEGQIPGDIGLLSKLQRFRMGTSNLTGQIPASLGNLSQLVEFAVAYNNLVGEIPETVGKLSRISIFVVGVNQLNGTIPLSLYNLSSLTTVTLVYNQFHGTIPRDIGLTLPSLKNYGISKNWMSGSIPQSFCNASQLVGINMNQNSLTGKIPTCLGSLSKLSAFHVGANNLGTNSDGDFRFITGLSNCSQLIELGVSANNLGGPLPNSIGNLSVTLDHLLVGANPINGNIPDGLENLVNLIRVDLSYNLFTGSIPSYIGKLHNLQGLLLSDNQLSGHIPTSFGNLSVLNRLDMTHNQLEGSIPLSLGSCQQLNRLDISGNKLSGEVPHKGVFANASGFSLTGNTLLCGGVIELHLKKCPTAKTIKQKRAATVKLTLEVVLPSLAFLLLSAILYQWKLWRSREKSVVEDTILSHFMMVSYKDLHRGTNGFSDDNLIGSGGFGTIYKGVLDQVGLDLVAVKVVNIQENIKDHKGNDFKALVFEFMSNGSLEDWLHSDRNLGLIQRLNILVDVASALHYLHDLCETPVVHCDLKPGNILLDADMVAHVGDFEYGMGMTVSVEGDVYSYGILVLEMLIGKRPTNEMFKDEMNLRDFVKASIPDGITSVLDPSVSLSVTNAEDRRRAGNGEADEIVESNMSATLKECLTSVLEIGLACSTTDVGQHLALTPVCPTDDAVSWRMDAMWLGEAAHVAFEFVPPEEPIRACGLLRPLCGGFVVYNEPLQSEYNEAQDCKRLTAKTRNGGGRPQKPIGPLPLRSLNRFAMSARRRTLVVGPISTGAP
ncbi:Putative receptor-like protein kinase At3g47110 [Linum grandiflorum]